MALFLSTGKRRQPTPAVLVLRVNLWLHSAHAPANVTSGNKALHRVAPRCIHPPQARRGGFVREAWKGSRRCPGALSVLPWRGGFVRRACNRVVAPRAFAHAAGGVLRRPGSLRHTRP